MTNLGSDERWIGHCAASDCFTSSSVSAVSIFLECSMSSARVFSLLSATPSDAFSFLVVFSYSWTFSFLPSLASLISRYRRDETVSKC